MRKKYLSALLFGALLFASAGTFTSCKDYDDDINNLQEQINTINTTLTELKSQIGTVGVSSVTFDETTGVLTVVDGTGTHAYNIATSAEVMVEAEIKDGKLYVNNEEIGAVVGEVTVKDGKLMVDGKEVASLGGESSVVLVKNEDTQTCTLTVGDQTVTLPLNADANVAAEVRLANNTSRFGRVAWGLASAANADWKGPKGAVTEGQLLVGYIDAIQVSVSPYSYDLSAQTLKLVDTEGNEAAVKVVATPNSVATSEGPATGDTRAASVDGKWNLSIEMTDDVTAENIADKFMSKDKCILYALEVNGKVISPYGIEISTEALKASATPAKTPADGSKVEYNGESVENADLTFVPGNKYEFVYADAKAYDSYITFEGAQGDLANSLNITADGMTVNIPSTVPANQTVTATIHVMNVDGTVLETATFDITTKASEIVAPVEGLKSEYKLTASTTDAPKITFDVTGVFSYEDLNLLKTASKDNFNVAVTSGNMADFFYYTAGNNGELTVNGAKLLKVGDDGKLTGWSADNDAISALKYVELTVSNGTNTLYNADSKAGVYTMEVTFKDGNNEIRKFTNELTVSMPSMSDFLTHTTGAAWTDADNLTMPLNEEGVIPSMYTAYALTKDAKAANVSFRFESLAYKTSASATTLSFDPILVTGTQIQEEDGSSDGQGNLTSKYCEVPGSDLTEAIKLNEAAVTVLKSDNTKDDSKKGSALRTVKVTTVYNVNGYELTDEFTMHFTNAIDGAKFVYLKSVKQSDGKYKWVESAIEKAVGNSITIAALPATGSDAVGIDPNATPTVEAEGLVLSYKDKYYTINGGTATGVNGVDVAFDTNWSFALNTEVVGADASASWGSSDGQLTITNLPANGIYDIVVTPTCKAAGKVGNNTSVWFTFPSLKISVK